MKADQLLFGVDRGRSASHVQVEGGVVKGRVLGKGLAVAHRRVPAELPGGGEHPGLRIDPDDTGGPEIGQLATQPAVAAAEVEHRPALHVRQESHQGWLLHRRVDAALRGPHLPVGVKEDRVVIMFCRLT